MPCAAADLAGLDCATLDVPLDRHSPKGAMVALALVRHRARVADQRAGTVIVTPGGPGASGVSFLSQFVAGPSTGRPGASATLLDRFDLISYDPRGVGLSDPLDCHTDAPTEPPAPTDPSPESAADVAKAVAAASASARWCADRAGARAAHLGTVEGAWDLERISASVASDRLVVLALSYGSELALVHHHYFPRPDVLYVFDAPVTPNADPYVRRAAQAQGFEAAFDAFVRWCSSTACAAGPDPRATYLAAEALVDKAPLPGTATTPLSANVLLSATLAAMYSERQWDALSRGLAAAAKGSGTTLARLFEQQQPAVVGGGADNEADMLRVISCTDRATSPNADAIASLADQLAADAALFGRFVAWQEASCLEWTALDPLPVTRARRPINAIVIGSTGDPATPYAWALELARTLGAPLITRQANTHTAYSFSPCVQSAVDAALLSRQLPDNLECD